MKYDQVKRTADEAAERLDDLWNAPASDYDREAFCELAIKHWPDISEEFSVMRKKLASVQHVLKQLSKLMEQ